MDNQLTISCPVGVASMMFSQFLLLSQDKRATDQEPQKATVEYALFMLQKQYIKASPSAKVAAIEESLSGLKEIQEYLSELKSTLTKELDAIDQLIKKE